MTWPSSSRSRLRETAVGGVYRLEISEFCAAIRVGRSLRCGAEKAIGSAQACLAAHEAVQKKARVIVA